MLQSIHDLFMKIQTMWSFQAVKVDTVLYVLCIFTCKTMIYENIWSDDFLNDTFDLKELKEFKNPTFTWSYISSKTGLDVDISLSLSCKFLIGP